MKRFAGTGLAVLSLIGLPIGAISAQGYDRWGYDDDELPGASAAIADALQREWQRGYGYVSRYRLARERYAYGNAVSSCGYEAEQEGNAPVRVTGVERIGADNYAVTGVIGGYDYEEGGGLYDDGDPLRLVPLAFQPDGGEPEPTERYYAPGSRTREQAPPAEAAPAPPPTPPPAPEAVPDEPAAPYDDDGGYGGDSYEQDYDVRDAGTRFSCVARGDGRIIELRLADH